MFGKNGLWQHKCHLFWILCSSVIQSIQCQHSTFSDCPGNMLFHIKKARQAPPPSLSLSPSLPPSTHGLACGRDNQARVSVGPWLLVLVNAISAVTHKAFVFHHAAVGAHPLCQPASLSPGIIYPRSTEHMGRTLPSLSLLPTLGTTPCLSQSGLPVLWADWCNVLSPPIGLIVIFRPTWLSRVRAIWHGEGYHESRCNHGDGFFQNTRWASRMYS